MQKEFVKNTVMDRLASLHDKITRNSFVSITYASAESAWASCRTADSITCFGREFSCGHPEVRVSSVPDGERLSRFRLVDLPDNLSLFCAVVAELSAAKATVARSELSFNSGGCVNARQRALGEMIMKRILAVVAVAGLASSAMGQFIASDPGPFNSSGPVGFAENGIFTYNYAGGAFQVGNILFTGTATSGGNGSFRSELRYRVTAPGGAFFDSGQLIAGTSWVGDAAANSSENANTLGVAGAGNWSFEFYETFNDAGIDAVWTNVSFDVQAGMAPPPPPPAVTRSFAGTPNVVLNNVPVNGSTIWTGVETGLTRGAGELANFGRYGSFGWDNAGNEVAYRFDHAGGDISATLTGLSSDLDFVLIDASGVTAGVVAVSEGFGGATSESLELLGAAAGTYYVVVDTFGTAFAGSNFTLTVIPAPGAFALLGLGGLAVARRRR
jgi:hypothetical protein